MIALTNGHATHTRAMFTWQRPVLVLLAAVLVTGCAKGWRPSERAIYSKACTAILALPDLPPGAAPQPIAQCRLHIGKSAARIDVPVAVGNAPAESYTVWFKRVARTWEPSGPAYRTASPPAGAGSMSPGQPE